jgi:hypothetical protein
MGQKHSRPGNGGLQDQNQLLQESQAQHTNQQQAPAGQNGYAASTVYQAQVGCLLMC